MLLIAKKLKRIALQRGMIYIKDKSGTNIDVQIFDTSQIDFSKTSFNYLEADNNKKACYICNGLCLWRTSLRNIR